MNLRVEFDPATAAKVAVFFETNGMAKAAAQLWQALSISAPYDIATRRKAGDALFELLQAKYPLGSVARGRMVLDILSQSFPTPKLSAAYFENLALLLKGRPRRSTSGQIVLGLGSGRCGSTTLSGAMATVADACSTHENPPLIDWNPCPEQLDFHFQRMRAMATSYALVFDASHWWLNVVDRLFTEFDGSKVVGLVRETESCVRSFLSIKGRGRGSINHWAPAENGIWGTTLGDPTYPSYELPPGSAADPDAAKAILIERYARGYNEALAELAQRHPTRVLLLRTEELNNHETSTRLAEFVNQPVRIPFTALNVGNTVDSDKALYRL